MTVFSPGTTVEKLLSIELKHINTTPGQLTKCVTYSTFNSHSHY